MIKKLSIIAVAGLSIFLSGCSLTSVSDEQYIQQTTTLSQMQGQMQDLLSGMNALRDQNEQLTSVLNNMQDYIDQENKINTTLQQATHGSANISDTGMDLTFNYSGDQAPVTGIDIPTIPLDISTGDLTGVIQNTSGGSMGSGTKTPSHNFLEELKKASANNRSGSQDHGTGSKINTGSSSSITQ